MEIPFDIQNLYRHWEHHIGHKPTQTTSTLLDSPELPKIITFATERMHIWQRKQSGQQPPFTTDEILQSHRFCNIYRELDRQTIEIHKMLNPLRDDFDIWLLNLAFNRFLVKPSTYNKVGALDFDPNHNAVVRQRLCELPSPKYGTAYVFPIGAIQRSDYDTREKFFTQYLPKIIPDIAKQLKQLSNASIVDALAVILPTFGFNLRFHWTEILIDVAYQFPEIINLFGDFPIGPGSLPTMKLLSASQPQDVLLQLANLSLPDFPYVQFAGQNVWLSAENWEGIGCEYRKYTNLLGGHGRKRRYKYR